MNVLSLNIRGLGVQGKASWVRNLRIQNEANCVFLQETQCSDVSGFDLEDFWGRGNFQSDCVEANGRSGGLITMCDPGFFTVMDVKKSQNTLLIIGTIRGSGVLTCLMNVYAPQQSVAKRVVWNDIEQSMSTAEGYWVVAGAFNSVRDSSERKNSKFHVSSTQEFNDFIDRANLHEYGLRGRKFTFAAGNKLSRIDRILVNWEFFMEWPFAEYRALCRDKSDHSPLILKIVSRNFGPKPFRFFNSWLDRNDFYEVVAGILNEARVDGAPDERLMKKFRLLRQGINTWKDACLSRELEEKRTLDQELNRL
ncbi:uncharacterized protein LOC110914308 [Helianthus annuus]|uniref:uncharacterized protein LOC110914308 n=1 Tax=Helianthus annuus TaxID=4232 RepID=UPI000B8F85EF|nr:uncharacterized protein LOC110914308 [Helianthus annuus]